MTENITLVVPTINRPEFYDWYRQDYYADQD